MLTGKRSLLHSVINRWAYLRSTGVPTDTVLSDTQETVECEPSAECESQHLSPRRPALSAPGPGPRPLPGRGRPRPLRLRPGLHDELGLLPPRHCHGPAGLWRLDTIIPGRSQVTLLSSLLFILTNQSSD